MATTTAPKKAKAYTMLSKVKSVKERAEVYIPSIMKSLDYQMIHPLENKRDTLSAQIFDLESMGLATDLNKGLRALTKEDCEARFAAIIQKKYELKILNLELEAKQAAFNELFIAE